MDLLHNPFMTSRLLKQKLKLVASIRTIRKYIKLLGWRKVRFSYCQIVSFNNRVKRYIFGCLCKLFKEDYRDVIFEDETTIEVRMTGYTNYRKPSSDILRAVGGKLGKHKHSNVKIHLLGGITRSGLTPLVIFKGRMNSIRFQHYLTLGLQLYLSSLRLLVRLLHPFQTTHHDH